MPLSPFLARRSLRLLAIPVAILVATACGGSDDDRAPFTVKVVGFNDYHGNLKSPGTFGQSTAVPAAERPPVGGAEFLAAHVARIKAQNPTDNVVVGAGDFVGASPLISSLFFDEPAVETLNRIGVEFNAVGNHEFDHGVQDLLRLQNGGCKAGGSGREANSCRGAEVGTPVPFEGAKFRWLSANVVHTASGATLLPAYGIKRFQGVDVAFIGLTLKETPTIVSPAGIAGYTFRDEVATVNALVPELRAKGVEAIVVLIHQGGFQSGSLADINGCDGNLQGTPIEAIVKGLDDAVDMVISGHTHSAYDCQVANAKGRAIPVTSAGAFGRVLTNIDLTIDPKRRDITAVSARNELVVRNDPAVPANATVAAIVDGYDRLTAPQANRVVGAIAAELPNSRADGACNMRAGELIADAQLAATAGATGARVAFINAGGVRSPGFVYAGSAAGEGDGNVTYGEAFTVQPFGNSLVTLTLTSTDLKNFLEEQFAGCRGQSATATRVAIPSAGFHYAWDGAAACGARVRDVTLTGSDGATETIVAADGSIAQPDRTWRVTVNNFMADGGDGYATLAAAGRDRQGGGQDIDALVDYLGGFAGAASAFRPGQRPEDRGAPRITRVNSASATCPGGANTNP